MQEKTAKNFERFPERLKLLVKELFENRPYRLSKVTGIAPQSVGDYMKGKNYPGFKQLLRIIEVSSVNPEWLLLGTGSMFGTAQEAADGSNESEAYKGTDSTLDALAERVVALKRELAISRSREGKQTPVDVHLAVEAILAETPNESKETVRVALGVLFEEFDVASGAALPAQRE